MNSNLLSKNTILYGPPGVGKTYNLINYAVSIIEKKNLNDIIKEDYSNVLKRYNVYQEEGKVLFTTFHQSYSYEEFVEGIKPKIELDDDSSDNLLYTIESGVFKTFCESAKKIEVNASEIGINKNPTIWKVSLHGAGTNPIKKDCFEKGRIRIGWTDKSHVLTDETEFNNPKERRILLDFQDEMKAGDLVLSLYDNEHIDGVGIVTGEYKWLEDVKNYNRSRKVNWILKGIKKNVYRINGNKKLTSSSVYRLKNIKLQDIITIINEYSLSTRISIDDNDDNYVFIIDEINRGNVSKIFGELITLIEDTKRLGEVEEREVLLPYSKDKFGVPSNVYILGTMNTADRSIALLDTALRRRFKFIEIEPNPDILSNIHIGKINLGKMLNVINRRIEVLYDKDHVIGHGYFSLLFNSSSIQVLGDIFKESILPLLQEYFYEDYSKIQLILGDNDKEDRFKFIKNEGLNQNKIFKGNIFIDLPDETYTIQKDAFYKEESYIGIYE